MTFNSADYTSNYVPFAYLGIFLVMICDVTHGVVMPHLDEVIPLVGPTTGGSVITLNGANITNTPTLFCKIGSAVVKATYFSSTSLRCLTPPTAVGTVPIEATANNVDFTTSGLTYTFQGDRLTSLSWRFS